MQASTSQHNMMVVDMVNDSYAAKEFSISVRAHKHSTEHQGLRSAMS